MIASRRQGQEVADPGSIRLFQNKIFVLKRYQISSEISHWWLMASRRRGQEVADLGGRTSEQGKDYLIGTNRNANTNTKDYVPHRFQQIQIQQYQESQNTLLELDGDLLSVYGSPAIKYLERPWNKQRAQVTFYSFASSLSLSLSLSSSPCHKYLI